MLCDETWLEPVSSGPPPLPLPDGKPPRGMIAFPFCVACQGTRALISGAQPSYRKLRFQGSSERVVENCVVCQAATVFYILRMK